MDIRPSASERMEKHGVEFRSGAMESQLELERERPGCLWRRQQGVTVEGESEGCMGLCEVD